MASTLRRPSTQLIASISGNWLTRDSTWNSNSHFAGQAHELLLAFQQTQAQALLGVLHVSRHGFLFALKLFVAEVGDGDDDG